FARDAVVENVTTRNSRGSGVNLRYCYDYRVQNCAVFDGFNKALSGHAYGISILFSRKGDLRRITTRNTRNGIDFSGCYDASVDGYDIEDCNYGIALAHVIHGGYFRVRHGKITRIATGGYAVGNSAVTAGLSNPQNHVFRDTIVQDLAYSFDEAADVTNDKPGVWFQSSISNCHAIDIEASYRRGGSISVENAVIVRLEGFPLGICVFEKIKTEAYYNDGNHGVGWCVHCKLAGDASTLGASSIGLLVVRDCYNRYGQGVLKGEGLKNVHSQNLTMSFAPGTAIKSLSTAHSVSNVVDSTAGVLAVV
ncbi:hypothetical protein, partial [Mesorhizobium sp. Z1-4]|uniref:hypothetical protein n=1 Tax=Mesorhizobium sp. Z1-4 TaxID=2448478 RepID=UPI0013DFCBD1